MSVVESKGSRVPVISDLCAVCDKPVKVRDRAWEIMDSVWGLVIASPYCSAVCVELAHGCPEDVAERQRRRIVIEA